MISHNGHIETKESPSGFQMRSTAKVEIIFEDYKSAREKYGFKMWDGMLGGISEVAEALEDEFDGIGGEEDLMAIFLTSFSTPTPTTKGSEDYWCQFALTAVTCFRKD